MAIVTRVCEGGYVRRAMSWGDGGRLAWLDGTLAVAAWIGGEGRTAVSAFLVSCFDGTLLGFAGTLAIAAWIGGEWGTTISTLLVGCLDSTLCGSFTSELAIAAWVS